MSALAVLKSSIGKKALMAITGLFLVLFVIGHLIGNLTIFLGPDTLNAYAKKLKDLGPLLWVVRGSLLLLVIVHIGAAIRLTIENREARPVGYVKTTSIQSTYAGRTMMVSGILIFVYVVYHILHLTAHVTHPEFAHLKDALGRHDVYAMVVTSFQNIYISAIYLIAMACLCAHLSHGIGSIAQSLGLTCESSHPKIKRLGLLLAWILFVGYASIPLAVLAGHLTLGEAL